MAHDLHFCVPSVATDLGCPDSVKITGNYISPPAAKMEAAPEVQLLVVLSAVWRTMHPHSPNIYLAKGRERI